MPRMRGRSHRDRSSGARGPESVLRLPLPAADRLAPLAAEFGAAPPIGPPRIPPVAPLERQADLRQRHLLAVAPVLPPRARALQPRHGERPAGPGPRVPADLLGGEH